MGDYKKKKRRKILREIKGDLKVGGFREFIIGEDLCIYVPEDGFYIPDLDWREVFLWYMSGDDGRPEGVFSSPSSETKEWASRVFEDFKAIGWWNGGVRLAWHKYQTSGRYYYYPLMFYELIGMEKIFTVEYDSGVYEGHMMVSIIWFPLDCIMSTLCIKVDWDGVTFDKGVLSPDSIEERYPEYDVEEALDLIEKKEMERIIDVLKKHSIRVEIRKGKRRRRR